MKLVSVEIDGFRGFAGSHTVDLDADAVIVVGANGHGKTSLFDSILWALSGCLPRLGEDQSRLVSMYSASGQARVCVKMRTEASEVVTVTRSFDGEHERLSLETTTANLQGPAAEGKLLELIWPDAGSASDSAAAMATVLTRSVYLQQDLIRHFVDAASDQDRFSAVSELVGAGRVAELQSALERQKRIWSTTTNQQQEEARLLRDRQTTVDARLADFERVAAQQPGVGQQDWDGWWTALRTHNVSAPQVALDGRDAGLALDRAIKEIDTRWRAHERRVFALNALASNIASLTSAQAPDIAALREGVELARQAALAAGRSVAAEQRRAMEEVRQQAALKAHAAQVRALAALALKQLGPV